MLRARCYSQPSTLNSQLPAALVTAALAAACAASAQEVLTPAPPEYTSRPQSQILPEVQNTPTSVLLAGQGTNQPEHALTTPYTAPGEVVLPERRLLDWGPVHLHPHPLYRFLYGNGINASPGSNHDTAVNEFDAGVLIDVGNHIHLDYTPSFRWYSSHEFRDSIDHAVQFNWATAYQDWTFSAHQGYVSSSTPLVETASQTDQQSFNTDLSATYQLNSKVSLDASLNQNIRLIGSAPGTISRFLSDSRSWSTTEGLNYQLFTGLSLGGSLTLGYDDLEVGTDMTYENLQGRLNWHIAKKLSLALSAGFEDRQFRSSGADDALNPIFSLSLIYQPFENTMVTLGATRTVSSSFFQNQLTETSGFNAAISQRLLGKLTLNISGGFSVATFSATSGSQSVDREDDRSFITGRLSCPFLKKASVSLFYDWSQNSSDAELFGYSSNQTGLELGYRF